MPYAESAVNPFMTDGVINTLEELHAASFLATPEQRNSFFKELAFEDFTNLLATIHESFNFEVSDVLSPNDHGPRYINQIEIDAQTGKEKPGWPIYIAPSHEHRRSLLEEAFDTAQRCNDMEQAATLLGLSLSTIHPFKDGNGRTSRVLYGMLTRGYDGSTDDQAYYRKLSSHEGGKIIYFSPDSANLEGSFIDREFSDRQILDEPQQVLNIRPDKATSLHWKVQRLLSSNIVGLMLEEGRFSLPPLLEQIKKQGGQIRDYSVATIDTESRQLLTLQIGKIYPNPNKVDIPELFDEHSKLKVAFVRAIIDCFKPETQNPLISAADLTKTYRPAQ